ncbi:glycosyltransferase [Petroclostridium sp. X23]|uniref:glycosyltransferase n=1 Tax=Petroclostridium sp. X23 TaxID=3045146 RepID=UPI0024ADD0DE|nr:glycosyltransferase [Petroclostridium sp. X23]WHH58377.1 glycosyltransferase [Petroclostridium sp. X23]
MIKVLYLLNHAGKGGTEQYVRILTEDFHQKKAECFFAYNEDGPLVEQMEGLGVETFQIPMKHPFDLQAAKKLSSLCKKLQIDIIHTQFLRENYIAILSRIFNPKVQVVYTNHFILHNNIIQKLTNRLLIPFEKAVIAVCNRGKEVMISNGLPQQKIKVVFNGVKYDADYLPESSNIRKELGIDEDTFVLLSLSRFSSEKGLDFLVKSIAQFSSISREKFKCLMVGDGALYDEIKGMVTQLGLDEYVIFTGFRTDIENIIMGSDLFINSSSNEALSFAILEVLSKGVPVIATDVGGNSDIISKENDCGILVPFGDEKAMAQAINQMIIEKDLYAGYKRNAPIVVRDKFNLEIMLKETYNLYIKE